MPMDLSVDFHFCAAHRLPYYDGPCFRMHGHNYRLQVVVTGTPNPRDGMIIDFEEIREEDLGARPQPVRPPHPQRLHGQSHRGKRDCLDVGPAEAPASELKELRLWETPEYCVSYRAD